MTSALFQPYQLGPVTLPNRIVVAPMCQYSANDGCMNDWHRQHLMNLGMSGAGLVTVEATGVERRGRITHGCTGLYDDASELAMAQVLLAARAVAAPETKFAIQLGHAGRKASSQRPWEGGGALKAAADPWQTIGPTDQPHADGWHTPRAMVSADMAAVSAAFVAASRRAVRLGFEAIELHLAHGYLLQQFLSPISNTRSDAYGGAALANRMRFPLEVVDAVRATVPADIALGVRISATDWVEGGWDIADSILLAQAVKSAGCDFICVSSGGPARMRVPTHPGYQVHFARAIKDRVDIGVRAVGLITDPHHAERIVAEGDADMVALARAFLDDPRWAWRAADALGAKIVRPPQYARVAPALWPGHAANQPKEAAE